MLGTAEAAAEKAKPAVSNVNAAQLTERMWQRELARQGEWAWAEVDWRLGGKGQPNALGREDALRDLLAGHARLQHTGSLRNDNERDTGVSGGRRVSRATNCPTRMAQAPSFPVTDSRGVGLNPPSDACLHGKARSQRAAPTPGVDKTTGQLQRLTLSITTGVAAFISE